MSDYNFMVEGRRLLGEASKSTPTEPFYKSKINGEWAVLVEIPSLKDEHGDFIHVVIAHLPFEKYADQQIFRLNQAFSDWCKP